MTREGCEANANVQAEWSFNKSVKKGKQEACSMVLLDNEHTHQTTHTPKKNNITLLRVIPTMAFQSFVLMP